MGGADILHDGRRTDRADGSSRESETPYRVDIYPATPPHLRGGKLSQRGSSISASICLLSVGDLYLSWSLVTTVCSLLTEPGFRVRSQGHGARSSIRFVTIHISRL